MIWIIKFNKFRNDKKYIGARDFQKIKKWRPLKKKSPLFWCAKRDLNPHGLPPEPKSGVSANSTIGAHIHFDAASKSPPFIDHISILIFLTIVNYILQTRGVPSFLVVSATGTQCFNI